ncbi:hypothetical protein [Homoserinibacter gongjuensis]|uniref:aldose epimerase family protein n=1 Tax=Homoserinibacter gongjuensis TaxID=1162968 RepID=UPI0024E0F10A|nr:hypothetical protein [Homoserinibacter gongjuensis]
MSTHTGVGERFELRAGQAFAEVGTVAAVLCALRVGDVDLTEPLPQDVAPPPFCSGIALAPWPNRVRAGRWSLDGAVQQLDITEPTRGGALHGLLEFTEYEVRERSDAAITLGAVIHPQHGWPFLLDTWVRFELAPDGLSVTHGARNLSERRAPYATGTHPYPRVGTADVADLVLTVPADEYLEVDERLDPIRWLPVEGVPTYAAGCAWANSRSTPRSADSGPTATSPRPSRPPTARVSRSGSRTTGATCRCSRRRSSRGAAASAPRSRSSR